MNAGAAAMRVLRAVSVGIWTSASLLLPALAAEDIPLNVKAGLWQVTAQGQHNAMPPMSPEALANMTLEQRARLEAELNDPQVYKSCLTQKEIEHLFEVGPGMKGRCKGKTSSSTPALREGTVQCGTATSVYHLEAPTPEAIRGSWEMTMAGPTMAIKPATLRYNLQGKWLSADCGNVKPGEQVQ
jgi:hypothetical protein